MGIPRAAHLLRRLGFIGFIGLSGCACSSPLGNDAGASMDAGVRDVVDAPSLDVAAMPDTFVPPFDAAALDAPGLCSPPAPWNRDRFAGDTQERRDADQIFNPLLGCSAAKGCATARFVVDEMGVIVEILEASEGILECVETELLGLCVPTWAGEERDESACYI